jgi:hypothetical protein
MKPIIIGQQGDGKPLFITPEMRQSTHTHVIGGSGKGKSKFLEWMIRKNIDEGEGFCLLDWHGTLYQDVLQYCAQLRVGVGYDFRSLILVNPSQPDYITGFNPFMNQGQDVATQVSRRIDATIRPWGITDTNLMPTFERVCRLLYTFAVEQRETLPNAAQLLHFERPELREYAARVVTDPYIRQQWQQLQQIKTYRDWKEFVLSTENRLSRFLASKTIKRFMGMNSRNLDLIDAMDKGKIVLVNLGTSGFLDRESARVFASLLLNEFFESAMMRATQATHGTKPKSFSLYLDEFQEYITDDISSMLDQVRKGGLHMILAHQHLGHLADNPQLRKSIFTNARIRAVFGGLDYEDSCIIANEMFLTDLNARQIKKAYYHTIHLYEEQTRTIRSRSTTTGTTAGTSRSFGSTSGAGDATSQNIGTSASTGFSAPGTSIGFNQNAALGQVEGWFTEGESSSNSSSNSSSSFSANSYTEGSSFNETFSEAEGETVVPVWVPIPVQELGSEAEWTREEKLSRVAEMLKYQQEQHCFIKLDTERTQPLKIPFVHDYFISPDNLLEYEKEVYETQGASPGVEVDHILEENEARFLTTARQAIDIAPNTPLAPAKSKKDKQSIFEIIDIDPIGKE